MFKIREFFYFTYLGLKEICTSPFYLICAFTFTYSVFNLGLYYGVYLAANMTPTQFECDSGNDYNHPHEAGDDFVYRFKRFAMLLNKIDQLPHADTPPNGAAPSPGH